MICEKSKYKLWGALWLNYRMFSCEIVYSYRLLKLKVNIKKCWVQAMYNSEGKIADALYEILNK